LLDLRPLLLLRPELALRRPLLPLRPRDDERDEDFDFDFERLRLGFGGTLPPSRRASDSPMAIACLRLVTFLPERPLRSVPCLRSCIARSTLLAAFLPYLAIWITSVVRRTIGPARAEPL
jgi:hypothetical protein